jgi:hypothetical protein
VVIPEQAQVARNSIQAVLVGAGPGSSVALTVRSDGGYPAHLHVYTHDGKGAEQAGTRLAGGYRYHFSLGGAGVALVAFAVPGGALITRVSLTVVAQPACRNHRTLTNMATFSVRTLLGKASGASPRQGKTVVRFTLPPAFAKVARIPRQAGAWVRMQASRTGARGVILIVFNVVLET